MQAAEPRPSTQGATDIHRSIDAVWRIESARLIAALTRIVRNVGLAEDLAQDALVAALERWPKSGIPDNPGAWLMATAKHRAIDNLRRNKLLDRKHEQLGYELAGSHQLTPDDINAAIDSPVADDLLRLIFISCHPVLSPESRVALTLRLLGGLTTDEIARAYLLSEPTVAQRIVRAKRTLSEANVPFEVPRGEEFTSRLASVLQVVYLIFNEGYSATAGDDWTRPALCDDALRLGRILAELTPAEPEVHGLAALMEIQASRLHARISPTGEPILLFDQDRSRWDQLLIGRGLAALALAEKLLISTQTVSSTGAGGAERSEPFISHQRSGAPSFVASSQRVGMNNASEPDSQDASTLAAGPYVLQAAIAACHARAPVAEDTDWPRIAALYEELAEITPSPIIELNRAVAISMAEGPEAGLEIVDALADEPALKGYHLLPSVRGDLLFKLNRLEEARTEFERAASLTRNAREQNLLRNRAQACTDQARTAAK